MGNDIRYLEPAGDMIRLQYMDGASLLAYPDGRGRFIPRRTGTTPPVDPPVDPTPGAWTHPLPGSTMTSPYGPREFDGLASFHYGIDFSTGGGGIVTAPADLVITIARPNWGSGGSAGNCVKGHTTDGAYTMNFYHMADGSLNVTEGTTVPKGTRLGIEGATGNAYGAHLHFELYSGALDDPWPPPYGDPIDPAPVLNAHGVTW